MSKNEHILVWGLIWALIKLLDILSHNCCNIALMLGLFIVAVNKKDNWVSSASRQWLVAQKIASIYTYLSVITQTRLHISVALLGATM